MTNRWNIAQIIVWGTKYLAKYQVNLPRLSVELMLASILGYNRIDLYLRYKQILSLKELLAFKRLLLRRCKQEPLAYILGKHEFWSLTLIITPDVLIPRPESEHLVSEALKLIKNKSNPRILDLCTGSGAIALALAKERIDAKIFAIDLSSAALAVANLNAFHLNLASRIHFLQGNLYEPIMTTEVFDLIIANPPYIAEPQWKTLMREVKDYEPKQALISGPKGLEISTKIISSASIYLSPLGWLLVELGSGQAQEAIDLAQTTQCYDNIYTIQDLAGIERVLICRRMG